ncbi:VOC family protein [Streptomyces sp. NPDC001815]|uniref:VOC family protein n=1 Tax=Streptomyces sp. NPDC001815 TaxID=3154526 RepID=UPI00332276A0
MKRWADSDRAVHHVLRAADLFGSLRKEHHIERGPGRHGVSNAFYLYLRDPDGHRVEIFTSGLLHR